MKKINGCRGTCIKRIVSFCGNHEKKKQFSSSIAQRNFLTILWY